MTTITTRRILASAAIAACAALAQAQPAQQPRPPGPQGQQPSPQQPQEGRHKVAQGDTLMDIAKRYYDDASLWHELQRANPDIRDERLLRPGSFVVVPPLPPGPVAIHVNGSASFTRNGRTQPLAVGSQLQDKDSVDVQQASYVTLRWPEGIVTHLLPGSSLRLVRPEGAALRSRMLELKSGTAESQVPKNSGEKAFQIRTRLGTAAVRGTGFGVRVGDTMITDVTDGTVALGTGARSLDLPAGSGAVADSSGKAPQAVPLLPAPQIVVEPLVTTDGVAQAVPVAGAAKYEFELAPSASPDATLRRVSSEVPNFPLQPLPEGSWRVRVRAVDSQGIPGLPGERIVMAISFPPPIPGAPAPGATVTQDQPGRFVCSEAPQASTYEIEFRSLDVQREPLRITVAPFCEGAIPPLPPGHYRWQAVATRQMAGGETLRSQPGPASTFTMLPSASAPAPQPQQRPQ